MEPWLIFIGIIVVIWTVGKVCGYLQQRQKVKLEEIKDIKREKRDLEEARIRVKRDREALDIIAKEKSQGFPWLAEAYSDYFYLQDLKDADYLEYKLHPAPKAADHDLLQKGKIKPIFITSTRLSEKAKEFANVLGVQVIENLPLKHYPSVKCNVSRRTGEKIYHLPFDQQYDRTLIEEERNECYVETVKEAQDLGFRRAFRWRGKRLERFL